MPTEISRQPRQACRSCGAPIVWISTEKGNRMPLDAKVQTFFLDDGRALHGRLSHFASCPNSAEHRKK